MKKETKGGDGVGIGIKKSFHLTVEPIGFLYLSGLIIQVISELIIIIHFQTN